MYLIVKQRQEESAIDITNATVTIMYHFLENNFPNYNITRSGKTTRLKIITPESIEDAKHEKRGWGYTGVGEPILTLIRAKKTNESKYQTNTIYVHIPRIRDIGINLYLLSDDKRIDLQTLYSMVKLVEKLEIDNWDIYADEDYWLTIEQKDM